MIQHQLRPAGLEVCCQCQAFSIEVSSSQLCVYKARVELHYVTRSVRGNYVMLYGESYGRAK